MATAKHNYNALLWWKNGYFVGAKDHRVVPRGVDNLKGISFDKELVEAPSWLESDSKYLLPLEFIYHKKES